MKEFIKVVLLFLIAILICSCTTITSDTNNDEIENDTGDLISLERGTHKRTESFNRTFDIIFYETADIKIGFIDDLYSEELIKENIELILEDYNLISSLEDRSPNKI